MQSVSIFGIKCPLPHYYLYIHAVPRTRGHTCLYLAFLATFLPFFWQMWLPVVHVGWQSVDGPRPRVPHSICKMISASATEQPGPSCQFGENYHIKRTNARLHKQEFFQTSANFPPNCKGQWFVSSALQSNDFSQTKINLHWQILTLICIDIYFHQLVFMRSKIKTLTLLTWSLHQNSFCCIFAISNLFMMTTLVTEFVEEFITL